VSLTLYFHPLASFCHKVLIALYENGTPFEPRFVDLANPDSRADMLARWPLGKMPVLHDRARDRTVPETSIIIEYLQQHHPGPVALLPRDDDACLQARLWDRFFDLYVSGPMQTIVGDRIRPADRNKDPYGVELARADLTTAYAMADAQLAGHAWAIGDAFTIADCAAAPALFYATILQPLDGGHPNLAAYFDRLMARPSVARVIDEARPYFQFFPFRDAMPARFRDG
jgi:glutathione S-transferase